MSPLCDKSLSSRTRGLFSAPNWIEWLTMLAIAGSLFALFRPRFQPRIGAGSAGCFNNLKMIMLALENYHDDQGCYPPAYVADKSGRPIHSWRVLILPYMEHAFVYDQYRLDEPWDGPNNRRLAETGPAHIFQCWHDHDRMKSTDTSYVAVVGPGTLWPGEQSAKRDDIKDFPRNVIAVVEVHNSGIHWMEPRDLHVLQMSPTINPPHGQGISSAHRNSANVAFADGRVRRLADLTPSETLRSWLHIADGTLRDPE